MREVEIESLGDQGDGIAKVERGYVLIVPEVGPGEEVTVEIENVRQNLAFAQVVDGSSTAVAGSSTDVGENQNEKNSEPASSDGDETE